MKFIQLKPSKIIEGILLPKQYHQKHRVREKSISKQGFTGVVSRDKAKNTLKTQCTEYSGANVASAS
jgi:hypothetical protein